MIKPHVDSIKFSGGIVAGVSLLSHAVMKLQHDHEDCHYPTQQEQDVETAHQAEVELFLPRRSLYILSGPARYQFAHSIEENSSIRHYRGGGEDGEPSSLAHLDADHGADTQQRDRRISLIFRDQK